MIAGLALPTVVSVGSEKIDDNDEVAQDRADATKTSTFASRSDNQAG